MAAPALTGKFREWNPAWLADWLQHPDRLDKHAKMPSLGINSEEAQAIAAALVHQHPVAPPAQGPKRAENVAAGEVLFHSLGCLACHTRGDDGNAPAWGGGDLTDVGRKRSEKWLKTWLQKPEEIAPQRRMPTFELSTAEVTVLAAYLAGAEPVAAPQPDAKLVERGNQLLDAFRCGQCHELPGTPQTPEIAVLREQPNWSRSCLAVEPDPQRHRPAFPQLTESDREALRNYLASIRQVPSPESEFERGRQLLAQKNCIACHPRGASAGIVPTAGAISRKDPALAGQSEALIPPSLNAVGDRLPDDVLKSAISGAQARRLPWLKVRMPRYQHSEAEQAALVKYLIGHDRIPEGLPDAFNGNRPKPATSAPRTETLLAGHTLVGGAGFSCVACHRFGKFEPRNVALGTRGSDLMQIGKRMRREYFLRWTRSPLRIVRDMEMPSFDKPMAGVLGGDIDRQLQALWEAVNDPDFNVPADPSVIEQALRVSPGNPARVVRDVFWLSDGDRDRYVARAFAVGFGNQQNVLFDLDSMLLREWWVGDFATQRTQGKSWYWQPGGVRLVESLGDLPSFVMKSPAGKAFLTPHFEQGTCGRLQSYAPSAHGINLRYTIAFQADDKPLEIQINETWTPLEGTTEKPIGWKRSIAARGIPEGYGLHLHWPELKNRVGTASVSTAAEAATLGLGDGKSSRYVPIAVSNDGARTIEIEYRNTAQPPPGNLPARPAQVAKAETLDVLPGYDAQRLPLDRSIMPTAIAWRPDGTLVFTSLKGHVYLARDTDGDGMEDSLSVFEEGLAAPYGVLADGDDVLVSHKPELLRLRDTNGDGRVDVREVVATGWGYSDNYHDWTCGIVRDARGNLYVGLGSDYTQPKRAKETTRWRGTVLQIAPSGQITPIGSAFRYPTGLAIREDDEIFVSDNQGVQNTFNEINHLRLGAHYGVPSVGDASHTSPPELPAIQVPHPWTRSVNGLVFLPQSGPNAPKFGPFAGHGIGCEYDNRFLMRFTLQRVGETFQGAAYP
ncbi:MAG TPA: c-type cytochrome, partial [Planctomycetaceae bacterium]|nr:c-type cytochrome [Planctomycetaceae bacterium]